MKETGCVSTASVGVSLNEHTVVWSIETGHSCLATTFSGVEVWWCTMELDPESTAANLFSFDEPGYEARTNVAEKIDVGAAPSAKVV